jgi:NhaP-type Na+/H+ or K+/H+ antiporter
VSLSGAIAAAIACAPLPPQVGASQKLACVIDGESLMNDGSALVIFLLLQKIVEGESVTVGGVRGCGGWVLGAWLEWCAGMDPEVTCQSVCVCVCARLRRHA